MNVCDGETKLGLKSLTDLDNASCRGQLYRKYDISDSFINMEGHTCNNEY